MQAHTYGRGWMIRSLPSQKVALSVLRRAASNLGDGHPSAAVPSASSTPRSHQQPHSLRIPSVASAPSAGGLRFGNRLALRSVPSLSPNFRSLHVLGAHWSVAGGKFARRRAGGGRGGRGGSGASMFSGRPDGYQHFKSDKSDRESSVNPPLHRTHPTDFRLILLPWDAPTLSPSLSPSWFSLLVPDSSSICLCLATKQMSVRPCVYEGERENEGERLHRVHRNR